MMGAEPTENAHSIEPRRRVQRANLGRSTVALLAGFVLLIVGFAALPHLAAWTQEWGTIPVYLTYFLVMSIAARLFWGGADPLLAAAKAAITWRH
jgi:hypothetical protein